LSRKTGQYYRLPTEAEWEFGARSGQTIKRSIFSGSNDIDSVAWYGKNAGYTLHRIKTKKKNQAGIFDMSGNAAEWCLDSYKKGYDQRAVSQETPDDNAGEFKVIRGGAWGAESKFCTVYSRYTFKKDVSGGSVGFRICKVKK